MPKDESSPAHRYPQQKYTIPDERFSHVHLDVVGPLPASEGQTYLLTAICRVTRHFEAMPFRDITAKSYADNYVLHWVARFGAPSIITTDRGRQFTSALWQELAEFLGAKLTHTTSYHPASNGLVERMHRTLKTALKTQANPTNQLSNLGFVLLGFRAAVKEDLGFSTSKITIGKPLRVHGQLLSAEHDNAHSQSNCGQQLTKFLNSLRPTEPRHSSSRKTYMERALEGCTHVFIQNTPNKSPLEPTYNEPFRVLRKHTKYFTVDLVSCIDNVSTDRIKAAHLIQHVSAPIPVNQYQPDVNEECDVTPAITFPCPPATPRPADRDERPTEATVNRFGIDVLSDHVGSESKPLRHCFHLWGVIIIIIIIFSFFQPCCQTLNQHTRTLL